MPALAKPSYRHVPISKPTLGEAEKQAVLEVLESGHIVAGPVGTRLEQSFAKLCDAKHAVAVNSGTSALFAALVANGIGQGDEVITTPFSFIASTNAILMTGAKPVFVDIELDTYNVDPNSIAPLVTARTKAILPVHMFGQPCDLDALNCVAQEYGIKLIENAAQAVQATYKRKPIGSSGTACFSLYATKNLMAAEGGMVTTDDSAIADTIRKIRHHGMTGRHHYEGLGYNLSMSDLHAAVGVAQLAQAPTFLHKRHQNADFYNRELRRVKIPSVRSYCRHAWHQYTVRIPSVNGTAQARNEFASYLRERGIGTGIFYPKPIHLEAHVNDALGYRPVLPRAEQLALQVLSLPVHPELTTEDLQYVVDTINAY